ncbi:MAG: glycerol kinase, partial [Desulfobacteraceae bacterium]|nr:glycerol kinase [Desulfobacteraceae bacterium]
TTALGAAYAAGLATGFWTSTAQLKANWSEDKRFEPAMPSEEREKMYSRWKKAIKRSYNWK